MRPLSLILAVTAACSLGFAQAPTSADETRKFEVASIRLHETKPSDASQPQALGLRINGSRVSVYQVKVIALIKLAFGLETYEISGGPDWIQSGPNNYDIQATSADVPTEAQVRVMLQNLLADRFKLTFHREPRELPVYALVVGKNGPKLKPTPEGVAFSIFAGGASTKGTGISGARLALILTSEVDRPVIDRTGLTGVYDFELRSAPEKRTRAGSEIRGPGETAQPTPPSETPEGPSIYTAVEEQLGLKLQPENIQSKC